MIVERAGLGDGIFFAVDFIVKMNRSDTTDLLHSLLGLREEGLLPPSMLALIENLEKATTENRAQA